MNNRPELPTNPICLPLFCKITYGNFEVDKWYFLIADNEERLCRITELYETSEDDQYVRVSVVSMRVCEEGNYGPWIDDDDSLSFHRSDDLEDEDPVRFYKLTNTD